MCNVTLITENIAEKKLKEIELNNKQEKLNAIINNPRILSVSLIWIINYLGSIQHLHKL